MKIVTSDQMKFIEARSEAAGVRMDTLMENAGLAIATAARKKIEGFIQRKFTGQPILVLVGPGNNGGDGLVTARHLFQWFAQPTVYQLRTRPEPDAKLDNIRSLGMPIIDSASDANLSLLQDCLNNTRMVIDALLGTGVNRPLEGMIKAVLEEVRLAKIRRPDMLILAADVPSGMNADTGEVEASTAPADLTVTLGYPKTGSFTPSGSVACGDLITADIGIPKGLDDKVELTLMTSDWSKTLLPKRPVWSNKGTFGRTLIVAGSQRYVGAASLAAAGAARSGTGLVTLALPGSIQSSIASQILEPTYLPLDESSPGTMKAEAATTILGELHQYNSLLVGCGVGREPTTQLAVKRILFESRTIGKPTVVDADGLNILASVPNWPKRFIQKAILTPHPREMARLLGHSDRLDPSERVAIATESARTWNKIVVLKGAYTVVASPDGNTLLSPFANPALASAGTGDVLAGVIAGLLSQGLSLEDAAAAGVYIHGMAGESARDDLGDAGVIASDLLPIIPKTIKLILTQ